MTTSMEDLAGLVHADVPPAPKADQPTPGRGRGRPRKDNPTPTAVTPGAPSPEKELPMPPKGIIADAVGNIYTLAGMGVMPFRPKTAGAIVAQSGECGKAWEELARQNPAVRKAILGLLATSAWGGVAAAHLPIVMALMAEGKAPKEKEASFPEATVQSRGFRPGSKAMENLLKKATPAAKPATPVPSANHVVPEDLAYSPPVNGAI